MEKQLYFFPFCENGNIKNHNNTTFVQFKNIHVFANIKPFSVLSANKEAFE